MRLYWLKPAVAGVSRAGKSVAALSDQCFVCAGSPVRVRHHCRVSTRSVRQLSLIRLNASRVPRPRDERAIGSTESAASPRIVSTVSRPYSCRSSGSISCRTAARRSVGLAASDTGLVFERMTVSQFERHQCFLRRRGRIEIGRRLTTALRAHTGHSLARRQIPKAAVCSRSKGGPSVSADVASVAALVIPPKSKQTATWGATR